MKLSAHQFLTRRQLFETCGIGVGKIALGSLLAGQAHRSLAAPPTAGDAGKEGPAGLHLPVKAKRVIYLFMAGAPSQLDLFDYKPKLVELEGKPLPLSVIDGQRYAFIQPDAAVLSPRFKFARHGQAGAEISEILPYTAAIADDLAIIRTVHTDQFNHAPAQLLVNTGGPLPGRPAMGSWLTYGIGSEADDLPGFVVLTSGGNLSGGAAMWDAGFLPGEHQGVPFRGVGDPILHVANPPGVTHQTQRQTLDLIEQLNRRQLSIVGDPEIATRMEAYEMAYRMQSRAPELMDYSGEDAATLEMYGAEPGKASFANNCLMARRLAERGVRFIQLYHGDWDHHSQVEQGLRKQCKATDQPCAALIKDLKQRGMLDDTLVIWGGEFGRTPMVEASAALGRSGGRDHHPQAFTMWMTGGGIRTGQTIGQTDELGFHPVESPVHVHDIQATILHQLGIDHERLTFNYAGRPFRLTDVHGKVIQELVS
jgi:uncharacterized protein (DUF1501 family)